MSAPAWWARGAVRAATYFLPRGETRLRYRREVLAELWGLSTREQLRHCRGVLLHSVSLTRSLQEPPSQPMGRPVPLHCRLHLWHVWHRFSTDDGRARYERCLRCGRDRQEYVDLLVS